MPFSKALTMRYAIKVATNLGQLSTLLGHRHQPYRGWGDVIRLAVSGVEALAN
jgi:hypothetical protein